MKNLRKEIDKVDAGILRLLARRKTLAKKVRGYKKAHNMPVRISEREVIVFKTRGALGKKLGLSPGFVKRLMALVIAESRKDQK